MENFTIKEPREYNELLQMLKSTDPNHADTFNVLFEQLINNDAFLKKFLEKLKETATQSAAGLMSAEDKQKLDGYHAEHFATADHGHDGRYNTKTEITTLLSQKAANSHSHTKASIIDFPTSMPANGGDADTLDGYHAEHFATADHGHTQVDNWRQGTDLPSTYPKGETIFFSNNPTNKFNGITYCTVHTIKGYIDNVPACIQFIYPYNTNGDRYYFREALYNNDAWRSWYEVITSANIGSQSVSHANTATSATKATQDGNGRVIASTYLPLTGGTISGAVTMNSTVRAANNGRMVALQSSAPSDTGMLWAW